MHYFVIDLTHGGVKIAVSLAKTGKFVYAYDIYNTLNDIDRQMLEIYGVNVTGLQHLKNLKGNVNVIYPVHLPLTHEEIKSHNPDLNYTFTTHHRAVREILDGWGEDIDKIEVTGVKGKTSCVFMLAEIFKDKNPLILSSLGAMIFENGKKSVLKKNISITPANIKESIDLAYKAANPICHISNGIVKDENIRKYSCAIFESSLGVSGIGDVGLLTNITENYPIAGKRSTAADAKSQVFDCRCVAAEKESLDEYYPDIEHDRVSSFSLDDENADMHLKDARYGLDKTTLTVVYSNVKTVNGNVLEGEITLEVFAPGKHHVSNVLGVILTALCLEISEEKIIAGLKNYRGIPGRTNLKLVENSTIIEEINPGINTNAIRSSIEMIGNTDDYYIAVGGDYGITCEEIDEDKASAFLDTVDADLILTGAVGLEISKKMTKKVKYMENYMETYDLAIKNNKNLLFIYRSDYRKISQR